MAVARSVGRTHRWRVRGTAAPGRGRRASPNGRTGASPRPPGRRQAARRQGGVEVTLPRTTSRPGRESRWEIEHLFEQFDSTPASGGVNARRTAPTETAGTAPVGSPERRTDPGQGQARGRPGGGGGGRREEPARGRRPAA